MNHEAVCRTAPATPGLLISHLNRLTTNKIGIFCSFVLPLIKYKNQLFTVLILNPIKDWVNILTFSDGHMGAPTLKQKRKNNSHTHP